MLRTIFLIIAGTYALSCFGAEYSCQVTRKLDREHEYAAEQIAKSQYSNRIEEANTGTFVSRCSLAPSVGKVTCDRYKIDRVEFDENVGIKKYYLFRSQYDFQLFADLSFVESNGRGGLAYGSCKLVSP